MWLCCFSSKFAIRKKSRWLPPVTPFSPRLLGDPVLFIHLVYLVEFVSVFQGFYDLLIVVVAECGALLWSSFVQIPGMRGSALKPL